jgi:dephospho-CoA kinase
MLQQGDIGVSKKVSTMFVLSRGTDMLIGLTGRNASGKSTIVDWFSKKGLKTASCSDSIRTWLSEQNIEPTRDALIEGGRELRRQGGAGILAEMLLKILDGEDAVIDSIRTPGEVEALREREDFLLVEVRANPDTRWERSQSRARAGDPIDKETFIRQEKVESVAKDAAGQALNATAELADLVILNDGTEQELLSDLEDLYMKLR